MAVDQVSESSELVAKRVLEARGAAGQRWRPWGWRGNAEVPGSVLRARPWRPDRLTLNPVERALDQGRLTARGVDRVLRVSWTIADLAGHGSPDGSDVAEALFYRTGEYRRAA